MKKLLRSIYNLFFTRITIYKWQIHFIALLMFTAGIGFSLSYLTNGFLLKNINAATSPWTQTDWSGGSTSGTVTGTVTTFQSSSNTVTDSSGQVTLAKAYSKATFKGTQLAGGSTNFNVGSKTALQYNTAQTYDDDYFTYDGGSPTYLTVDQDGDYFVSLTMDLFSDGGEDSANRNGIEADVRVNGTTVAVGRSTYIRNFNGHNEGTANVGIFLNDLTAGDDIEVYVARTTNETAHNITGPFTLYAEYIPATETIFAGNGTRTVASTDLNGSTASAIEWTEVQKDSGYTHDDGSNPHNITLDEAGSYFVSVNIPLGSTSQRANVTGRVVLDGSQVDGGVFNQGYIRNASSHSDASIHWNGVVTSDSVDEVLTITTEQEATSGTVTVDGYEADIFIQKLPSTGVYVAEATTVGGSTNWNPSSELTIDWGTDEIIDTDEFTHSTVSNSDEITVVNGGDYVLAFNGAFSSALQRGAPSFQVKVNGSNVTGAVSRSAYIRNGSSHNEASSTMYLPLLGLSAGDVITVAGVADAVTGSVDDTTPAQLVLIQKDYASSGTVTSNILDAEFPADWGTLTYTSSGTGTVSVKVRTDSNSDMSGATAWASCTAISSGADMSSNGCVTDTDQYVQYQVTLEPGSGGTPVFEDISLGFTASDQIAPDTNATSIAMSNVSDAAWTNAGPTVTWTAGADNVGGVGLDGYCIALDEVNAGDSSNSLDPATTSGTVLSGLDDGVSNTACDYIVTGTSVNLSSISNLTLTSGKQYYISMKAVDAAGNIYTGASGTWQDLISFKYDSTKPTNPSFISLASDFIATKEATIIWPTTGNDAASDAHSGLAGLQYKIGSGGLWYGDDHTVGGNDSDDLLANDGSYTTVQDPDFDNIVEGNNLIFFRTKDNAGNFSTTYVSGVLKVNSTAPSGVENLAVTPSDNTTNSYTFSWEAPVTYTGQEDNITYCYSVNALPTSTNCTYTSAGQTSLSAGAYATLPGTNVLYVVARDEAENINYDTYESIEFTYSGSAPGIPQNAEVADISVKATSAWKLVFTWEEPTDIGAGIDSYEVFRSTTDAACTSNISSFTSIGSTSGLSYTDTGLSQANYYYCVRACDNASNCGSYSSTVTGYPDGKFTTAANLTAGPTVSATTTKKATITWSTDRESDSKIAFGTSSGNYNSEEVSSSTQETSHTINLTNLKAGTTYYYVAKWTDEDGNTGTSEEKSFTTESAPVVKDIEVSNIGIDSALLSFTATGASKAIVYYGPTTTFGGLSEVSTSTAETTYTIPLTGLEDDTEYFYKINLLDTEEEEYEGSVLDFATLPRPRVTNVRIQEVPQAANPTVLVTWSANTDISSIVTYYPEGNAAAAQDVVDVARKSGTHRMLLKGLLPNQRYVLIAKGIDKAGNEAVSDSQTFTTSTDTRPPVISELSVEGNVQAKQTTDENNNVQLIVSWNTDEPSTSQVEFGEGTGTTYSQQTQEDKNLAFNHVVIISGLTPSKVYHLRAISRDEGGNVGKSIDTVTIAPKVSDDALSLVLSNLRETFGFLDAFVK